MSEVRFWLRGLIEIVTMNVGERERKILKIREEMTDMEESKDDPLMVLKKRL